jgi:hypothetical protein
MNTQHQITLDQITLEKIWEINIGRSSLEDLIGFHLPRLTGNYSKKWPFRLQDSEDTPSLWCDSDTLYELKKAAMNAENDLFDGIHMIERLLDIIDIRCPEKIDKKDRLRVVAVIDLLMGAMCSVEDTKEVLAKARLVHAPEPNQHA